MESERELISVAFNWLMDGEGRENEALPDVADDSEQGLKRTQEKRLK